MKPYYQDYAVMLYHRYCREVLPTLDKACVSLVIEDPPYGVAIGIEIEERYCEIAARRMSQEVLAL